jgi:ppGpp synthetase/RelA/SpoT-type nucleotidyltranferase
MKAPPELTARDEARINVLVEHFLANKPKFVSLLEQLNSSLSNDATLTGLVHSIKSRVKDPGHLKEKLERKMKGAKKRKESFDVTVENFFERFNDLAGLRILHLHTRQFRSIHECLMRIFEEDKYDLVEGPIARTWDDESRKFFKEIGIDTKDSPSMYTSVHYVIAPNKKSRITCEVQVRTLAEELWGEVDHTINYPDESPSLPCREQIKVLARATSSCTRLVDSIFRSHEDYERQKRSARAASAEPQKARRGRSRKPPKPTSPVNH